MKNNLIALLVGLLFAIGLGISGMTNPEKVFGFLDVSGQWDPSLVFVMLGAVMVHFIAFKFIFKRPTPLFSTQWHIPQKKELTPALLIGSFIFGVGWAIGGYCPGPAMTALASFQFRPVLFFVFMLLGMLLFKLLEKPLKIKR